MLSRACNCEMGKNQRETEQFKFRAISGPSQSNRHETPSPSMTFWVISRTSAYASINWSAGCMLQSVSDDLELFINRLQLDEVRNESAATFYFPKLTEEEMKLVSSKNEYHLKSYLAYDCDSDPDVDESEMKLSDSKSKFVNVYCERQTCIITNRPINGYFKRKIVIEYPRKSKQSRKIKSKTKMENNGQWRTFDSF